MFELSTEIMLKHKENLELFEFTNKLKFANLYPKLIKLRSAYVIEHGKGKRA